VIIRGFWILAGALVACAWMGFMVQAQEAGVSLELNRADTVEAKCRVTIVVRNGLDIPLEALAFDVVVFDKSSGVAGYSGLDLGGLQPAKTRVRQYDIAQLPCAEISRLLINDIRRCGSDADQDACAKALTLSSRTAIDFSL